MPSVLISSNLINDDLRAGHGRMRGEARVWRKLMGGRAGRALGRPKGGAKGGGPSPVIVKNISSLRDRRGVVRLIRYIGRLDGEAFEPKNAETESRRRRADQQPKLRNGDGDLLDRSRVVERLVRDWEIDDQSNLTEAARILDALATGASLVEVPDGRGRRVIRLVQEPDGAGIRVDRRLVDRLVRVGALELETADGPVLSGESDEPARWTRLADLPVEDRFRDVRVRHVMMSVPVDSKARGRIVESAVARTVAQTFESWGFPSVWATHREHGKHIHVHIAVRCDRPDGDRLSLDDRVCDLLRTTLAENARALGLDTEGTRRVDRPEIFEKVRSGEARLHDQRSRADYRDGVDGLPREFREAVRLAQRVPEWFADFGGDFMSREADRKIEMQLRRLRGRSASGDEDEHGGPPGRLHVPEDDEGDKSVGRLARLRSFFTKTPADQAPGRLPPDIPDPGKPLAKRVRDLGLFKNDEPAMRSFMAMASEDKALAVWYLRHRPGLFGDVNPRKTRQASRDCALRAAARNLPSTRRPPVREAAAISMTGIKAVAMSAQAADMARVVAGHERLATEVETLTPLADHRLPQQLRLQAKETAIALRNLAADLLERAQAGDEDGMANAARVRVEQLVAVASSGRQQGAGGLWASHAFVPGRSPDRGGRGDRER